MMPHGYRLLFLLLLMLASVLNTWTATADAQAAEDSIGAPPSLENTDQLPVRAETNQELARQVADPAAQLAQPYPDEAHRELADTNARLRAQIVSLAEVETALRVENQQLRDGNQRYWFLLGGAVLATGIVIGLIAPSLRLRRRKRWNEL